MENLDSLVEQGIMGGDKPVNEQNETKPHHQDHSQNMLKPLEKTKDKSSDNRKEIYSHIEKELGKEIADKWLHETLKQDYATVKQGNQKYLQELSGKYKTFLDIPEINEAISDFLGSDVDHCSCFKEQGIAKAFDHIVNVYQSGFKAAQGLKSQNESAKSRMISSINQLQPAVDRKKSFSRADIKSMSPEDFSKNEKAIFEQMSKGLIK